MNYSDAMDFIGQFTKSGGPIMDLSRAQQLMDSLGHPEKQLRFVHVAGTNGKGTTVEFVSEALMDAGYTVGQFTSPFILRYNDRIRVNGVEIPDDELAEICETVAENAGQRRDFSQFEITMAIAMLFFLKKRCDVVVLEAGIGGLLDCTNVIPAPDVAVITSISLDHTALLGNTVEKIAAQKAGIIKPGCDVVIGGCLPDEAEKVIRDTCAANGVRLFRNDMKYTVSAGLEKPCVSSEFGDFHLKMNSVASWKNLGTALEVCLRLKERGFRLTKQNIISGFNRTKVLGRTEVIKGDPVVILDGGHNPEGVESLAETMHLFYGDSKKVFAVAGMIKSKDYRSCIEKIGEFASRVLTVDDFAPNAVPAQELAQLCGENAQAVGALTNAYKQATELAKAHGGAVLVCGSLYLVSQFAGSDMYRGDRK